MNRQTLAVVLVVLVSPAWAADYYVKTSGADVAGCGTQAAPCKGINYLFTQFSAAPSAADPAVVHVGPGTYRENAGPSAPQTGFAVPNFTHLISDRGADETTLEVDLGGLALAGIVEVVRGKSFGIPDNAEGIVLDGFLIQGPGGAAVTLPSHQIVGVNFGSGVQTRVAPRNNIIRNNVISVQNTLGLTQSNREGAGVFTSGGATIDCNIFQDIDSVGISMSSVDSDDAGVNTTAPGLITRNWFRRFTSSNTDPDGGTKPSDDEFIAVGVRVPTTIRGNLLDFQRPDTTDRGFGIACFDCTGLVVENNVMVNFAADSAAVGLVSLGKYNASPRSPRFAFNTIARATEGFHHWVYDENAEINFTPQVSDSIVWASTPFRDVTGMVSVSISYSNLQNMVMGTGNQSADPLFVSDTAGDFRLGPSSPSMSAGQAGAQQGAYGGASPFGAPGAPQKACQLRETPGDFPDTCAVLADGSHCASPTCAGNGVQWPVCSAQVCSATQTVTESCDDQDPCTADLCEAGVGCANVSNGLCEAVGAPGPVLVIGVCGCGAVDGVASWVALLGLGAFSLRRRSRKNTTR
jgi:hypothetical protein